MSAEYVRLLSQARFRPYLDACEGNQVRGLHLYRWNQQVCAALLPVLGDFEIVLRNSVHHRLAERYRTDDWWSKAWADLNPVHQRQIDEAEADRMRVYPRRPVTPDCIVSNLTFAFWVGMFARRNNYETCFWRPALRHVFKHHRGGPTPLYERLTTIRLLRNRVSHHEPIFTRHLEADHRKIIDMLRLISPEMASTVESSSRVTQVLTEAPGGLR